MKNNNPIKVSRRGFFRIAAATFVMLTLAGILLAAAAEDLVSQKRLKIGVIGSGRIGGTLGALWVKAGHEVFFSSRHPDQLKELVERLGPMAQAGMPREAAVFGDVVLMTSTAPETVTEIKQFAKRNEEETLKMKKEMKAKKAK